MRLVQFLIKPSKCRIFAKNTFRRDVFRIATRFGYFIGTVKRAPPVTTCINVLRCIYIDATFRAYWDVLFSANRPECVVSSCLIYTEIQLNECRFLFDESYELKYFKLRNVNKSTSRLLAVHMTIELFDLKGDRFAGNHRFTVNLNKSKPHQLQNFSQSYCLIEIVESDSHTLLKSVQIQISLLLQQLI